MTQEVLALRSSFRPLALRAVQLMVAFTMLAAPAEAFALSGTAASSDISARRPLAVRITPREVRLGAPVRVSGRLPAAAAGTTVALQAARSLRGPWRRVASARTGAAGGYRLRVSLSHSMLLRAVALPTPFVMPGAAPVAHSTLGPGMSAVRSSRPAKVQVRAALRVARRNRGVQAGRPVLLAGHLLPGRAGRTVSLQRRGPRSWSTIGHARTGRRGGFAVRFRPPVGAGGRLRVVFAGDHANGRVSAGAGTLAIYEPVLVSWYVDAGTTACGFHATYGIANRTLPCGTRVRLRRGGRTVIATVDDRGPYVGGREYDLNQTTAGALGFAGVGTIEASIQ
jgi:rare lipoprotein A